MGSGEYVERFVKHTVSVLVAEPNPEEPMKPVFRLHLIENILSCLIYNPDASRERD
ncbi:hypothetical protein [Citrobacter youngae]|uniref:hypothetical protein n=1 Tax=Citrobacter youngae TaxID=133448 RepID=UPI0013D6EF85|nr:hypothetical protein [Citrobacter youngae]